MSEPTRAQLNTQRWELRDRLAAIEAKIDDLNAERDRLCDGLQKLNNEIMVHGILMNLPVRMAMAEDVGDQAAQGQVVTTENKIVQFSNSNASSRHDETTLPPAA